MKYCKKCGNELTIERAFGTIDEQFYYSCRNCEYNVEDKMIVIKTDMETMPKKCEECTYRVYSYVEEKYMCRETLEDVDSNECRPISCPLIEIQ